MNWDAIGAVGEIAGAIAVVASLVYLATQIRQNNKLLRLESDKYVTGQMTSIGDMVLNDESLIELMQKDTSELTSTEKARLMLLARRMLTSIEQVWANSPDKTSLVEDAIHAMYHRPGMNYGMPLLWPEHQKMMSPEFVSWFNEKVVPK